MIVCIARPTVSSSWIAVSTEFIPTINTIDPSSSHVSLVTQSTITGHSCGRDEVIQFKWPGAVGPCARRRPGNHTKCRFGSERALTSRAYIPHNAHRALPVHILSSNARRRIYSAAMHETKSMKAREARCRTKYRRVHQIMPVGASILPHCSRNTDSWSPPQK